ncbi:MAG: TIM barrel protein [Proteobacteria bacterium]|nr:TIM barrel protein [Pseudomonadota bacterium]
MAHRLSLEHLTVAHVGPLELLDIARDCGCAAVNLRMEPAPYLPVPYYDVIGSRTMRADIRARAAGNGVLIHTVDPFVLREDSSRQKLQPYLDSAADIGAQAINVVCYDFDLPRMTANLAQLATDASERGMVTRIELFAFSAINSLAKVVALIEATGRDDVLMNADFLHITRTGGTAAELAAIPRRLIGYAQACDGPAQMPVDQQMAEATLNRLAPGTGEFDMKGLIRALPDDIIIGLEVPSADLTQAGYAPAQKARIIVDAMRRVQAEAER